MRWSILLYGLVLGLLLAALQFLQYRLLVIDYARELYTGIIAVLFCAVGIWAGRKLRAAPATTTAVEHRQEASFVPKTGDRAGLTERELEVLQLLALGHTNQQIADRLFVSLNTVKTHVSNIFVKLEADRRTQAVRRARALGLVE